MADHIEVQPLIKTIIFTVNGVEHDIPVDDARKIYKQLGEALGEDKKPSDAINFFITNNSEEKIADSVARDIFWTITNQSAK